MTRVHFHLAEIGIEREVEGQAVAEPHLQVQAAVGREFLAAAERIPSSGRRKLALLAT